MTERGHRGALVGLLAAGLALGSAELVAVGFRPEASPVVAVGGVLIDLTPEPVKEFAIQTFGPYNKLVLLAGMLLAIALLAVILGRLAARRPWLGAAGFAAFGLLGAAAAIARPGGGPLEAVPAVVGASAGIAVLWWLRPVAGTEPVEPADRRRFLLAGAGVAGLALVAGVGGRWLQQVRFGAARSRAAVRIPDPASPAPAAAGTDVGVPGMDPFITPNRDFYRVDTALTVPQVPAETWSLRITGMVDRPLELSYAELLARPLVERDITLACVSNEVGGAYVGNARWIGVRVRDLLSEAGVRSGADQVVCRSADGMTIGTPTAAVMDGRDALLAVAMNGEPLPLEHGFPVRMVVPGLYGYVSACKWIVEMELTTFDAYDAYWIKRGWAEQAPIKTASRIDTPRGGATPATGRVMVAGVAWAQHRGISRVEVRIDEGVWTEARLAAAPSTDTWRQWAYPWDATAGRHTIRVRATDTTGQTQPEARAAPYPDGATGWHTITVTVR